MSTLIVKVCEECGQRSASTEGWLQVSNVDIRCAKSGEPMLRQSDVDVCSRGCLLRYVSSKLERANCRGSHAPEDEEPRREDAEDASVSFM